MSGVGEAGLVLGLISSLIQTIAAAKGLYEAANDVDGLPEAFKDVAAKLPLVQIFLEEAKEYIKTSDLDSRKHEALIKVLKSCKKRADQLDAVFTKLVPKDDTPRRIRYMMALRQVGKRSLVENLIGEILKGMHLLSTYFAFSESSQRAIAKAWNEVLTITPSLPDSLDADSIEPVEGTRLALREFRSQFSQHRRYHLKRSLSSIW
jgi:hypothetical protein